jgi:PBSX family phage terminase large subunit
MVLAERPGVVTYRPRGGHRRLFSCRDQVVVLEGPAGTGKTYAGLWYLHAMALKYPKMRALIARKTLNSLTGSALVTFHRQILGSGHYAVEPYGGSKFSPGAYRYQQNGSEVVPGGMDKASKVMSAEYDLIYIPEATELSETDAQALMTRLRNGKMPYQQLLMDCNPAGPQHWINAWCNTGRATRIPTTHKDNPLWWDRDAEDWTPEGLEYMRKLWALTGTMRKRLLDGVWAAAEGIVYPEFVYADHVRQVDTDGWRTVLGVDVGARNPTAILTAHVAGDERIHISHEFYRREMTSTDILDAIRGEADRHRPDAIYIDPSAKGYIDDLRRMRYPVQKATNDVIGGINRVRTALTSGFTIDPACTNTIDEFGMYAYPDQARIETDNPKPEHDHAMDALRYLVAGVLAVKRKRGKLAGV